MRLSFIKFISLSTLVTCLLPLCAMQREKSAPPEQKKSAQKELSSQSISSFRESIEAVLSVGEEWNWYCHFSPVLLDMSDDSDLEKLEILAEALMNSVEAGLIASTAFSYQILIERLYKTNPCLEKSATIGALYKRLIVLLKSREDGAQDDEEWGTDWRSPQIVQQVADSNKASKKQELVAEAKKSNLLYAESLTSLELLWESYRKNCVEREQAQLERDTIVQRFKNRSRGESSEQNRELLNNSLQIVYAYGLLHGCLTAEKYLLELLGKALQLAEECSHAYEQAQLLADGASTTVSLKSPPLFEVNLKEYRIAWQKWAEAFREHTGFSKKEHLLQLVALSHTDHALLVAQAKKHLTESFEKKLIEGDPVLGILNDARKQAKELNQRLSALENGVKRSEQYARGAVMKALEVAKITYLMYQKALERIDEEEEFNKKILLLLKEGDLTQENHNQIASYQKELERSRQECKAELGRLDKMLEDLVLKLSFSAPL